MSRPDLACAREGQAVRKRLCVGDVDNLEFTFAHGFDQELRVRVDHHCAKIQLTTFEHCELFVPGVRRHLEIQLGKRSQHLPRHLLSAAPNRTDSDPLSAQIRHRLNPVRVASEHHERLGRR